MSVTNPQSLYQFAIASLGQAFNPPLSIQNASDLVAIFTSATTLADTALTLGVDFTVTGTFTNGICANPTLTLEASGSHYAVGGTLTIQRASPLTQPTTFLDGTKYLAATTNNGLDWLCYSVQQIRDLVARCLQVPLTSQVQNSVPLSSRKGMIAAWDSNGNFTATSPLQVASGTVAAAIASSVATLRLLAAAQWQTGSPIFLSGYYAPGDGGEGWFTWSSASTATDDGGSVIQLTGVTTGRLLRVFGGKVSVKQFGAKGDFFNHDDAPINAAVAYLTSVGGGTLYFPACTTAYGVVNAVNVVSNVRYTGDGPASVIKSLASSTDSVMSTGAQSGTANSIEIDHLLIDGNQTNCAYNTRGGGGSTDDSWQIGIRLGLSGSNCRIHDCTIQNTVMDGISVYGVANCFVSNNTVLNCGKGGSVTGSASYAGLIYEGNCQSSLCEGNYISGCLGQGVWYDLGSSSAYNDIICRGNMITGCGDQGIFFFVNSGATATTADRVVISDNVIKACGITKTDPGLEIANSTSTCLVHGLIVEGNSLTGCYDGIYIGQGGSTAGQFTAPIITGNSVFDSTSGGGFAVLTECTAVVFTCNVSKGNAATDVLTGSFASYNSNSQDNGPTPTFTLGTGAGTGATGAVTLSQGTGVVQVNAAGTPAGTAAIITVTFPVKLAAAPQGIVLTPQNAVTATLSGSGQVYPTSFSTTGFTIQAQSALAASNLYAWSFQMPL